MLKYLNKKMDAFVIKCSKLDFLKDKPIATVELFCIVVIMSTTLMVDFLTFSNTFFDVITILVMLFLIYRDMNIKI